MYLLPGLCIKSNTLYNSSIIDIGYLGRFLVSIFVGYSLGRLILGWLLLFNPLDILHCLFLSLGICRNEQLEFEFEGSGWYDFSLLEFHIF